ncbi:MAG: VTT domain-containing protein [Tepidisphaeraceae bacterium]
MEFFHKLVHLIFGNLGNNEAWRDMIAYIGTPSLYAVLFAIIFLETGVVILPFLPGDSLLFAIGAMSARDIGLHFWAIFGLLWVAAVIGDAVNYSIGKTLGPAVFNRATDAPAKFTDKLLNRKHLEKAQAFYVKYGGKTIILARFVPVVRTFAPFVAGVGKMSYPRFFMFNVVGGLLWVGLCMGAGRLFGRFEFVQKRFELVVIAIIVISILPMVVEFWRKKRRKTRRRPHPRSHHHRRTRRPRVSLHVGATPASPVCADRAESHTRARQASPLQNHPRSSGSTKIRR